MTGADERYHQLARQVRELCDHEEDAAVRFNALAGPLLLALGQMAPVDRAAAAQGLRLAAQAVDALQNRAGEPADAAMGEVVAQVAGVGLGFEGEPGQRRKYEAAEAGAGTIGPQP